MAKLKRFNEDINIGEGQTLSEFIGEIVEDNRNSVNVTTKGVYSSLTKGDLEGEYGFGKDLIRLRNSYNSNKDIYTIDLKHQNQKYFDEFGYVLMKDGKPFILSTIPGDDRGAVVFNNTFIVSGHDGSCLYNINDPLDYMNNTH